MTTTIETIAPKPNLEALSRTEKARQEENRLREVYTVALADVPGKGRTRKISVWRGCREGQCGTPIFAFGAEDHSWYLPHSVCEACSLAEVVAADDPMALVDPLDQAMTDLAKFRKEYGPILASAIEPHVRKLCGRREHSGVFQPGAITRPRGQSGCSDRTIARPILDSTWLELIALHTSGDHGLFGSSSTVKLDGTSRTFARLYDIATRNAYAIEVGGLVRSRFPRPGSDEVLDIATLIGPGGNVTHARVSAAGDQCFHDER